MIPRWLVWTFVTLVSWGIWAILSKLIDDAVTPVHSQILSTVGLLPIIAVLLLGRDEQRVDGEPRVTQRNMTYGAILAFGSGITSPVGNIPFYYLLSGGNSAAAAIAVTAMAPLITLLLAVAFLGERLNRIQMSGIAFSLIAIYLFNYNVADDQGFVSRWLVIAMLPIGLWGLTGFLQKMATNHVSGRQSAFWFLVAFLPVALLLGLWTTPSWNLSWRLWGLTAALGFTLAFGNLTILMAYASGGKASIIAPMSGLYPLISAPIAVLWLREIVSRREWWGIAMAMVAVVAIATESRHETPVE